MELAIPKENLFPSWFSKKNGNMDAGITIQASERRSVMITLIIRLLIKSSFLVFSTKALCWSSIGRSVGPGETFGQTSVEY